MKKILHKTAYAIVLSFVLAFFCCPDLSSDSDPGDTKITVNVSSVQDVPSESAQPALPPKSVQNTIAPESRSFASENNEQNITRQPASSPAADEALSCTLSVTCDTILNNIENLKKEKTELVPEDGIIFPKQEVKFYEGESVFNVLLRETKKHRIHFEFVNTPLYNSTYIEGIANLYEFDCGELSGWMYKVNGVFPSYSCSDYILKQGDRIEIIYSCDLGKDVK